MEMASEKDQSRRDEWLHQWKRDNQDTIVMMGLQCMRQLAHDAAQAEHDHLRAAIVKDLRQAADDICPDGEVADVTGAAESHVLLDYAERYEKGEGP